MTRSETVNSWAGSPDSALWADCHKPATMEEQWRTMNKKRESTEVKL
jgi:hypothetical protein